MLRLLLDLGERLCVWVICPSVSSLHDIGIIAVLCGIHIVSRDVWRTAHVLSSHGRHEGDRDKRLPDDTRVFAVKVVQQTKVFDVFAIRAENRRVDEQE